MRVIAGKYRSRRLKIVAGSQTRSTKDRVKETLFNMLGPFSGDETCLDLFAGSGALGIEASSRGASAVDFVECDDEAFTVLTENIRNFDIDPVHVHKTTTSTFINQTAAKYRLILLDPPYESRLAEKTLVELAKHRLLETDGTIALLVHKDALPTCPEGLITVKERHVGITTILFLKWRD